MRTGYSLLVDEYVHASGAVPADCNELHICCPVCRKPVLLETESSPPHFRHLTPLFPAFEEECKSWQSQFDNDYCHQYNTQRRRRRLDFLLGEQFIALLGRDPLGPYEHPESIWKETPKLLDMGALTRILDWHWSCVMYPSRDRFSDPVDFFKSAEDYLRSTDLKAPTVPESGLRRQIHVQVAFDLMQTFASRKSWTNGYDWLFVHAFRNSIGNWASIAGIRNDDLPIFDPEDEIRREHAAAASILGYCALKLLSDDKQEIDTAIETLYAIETKPPIMKDNVPFMVLFGAEIACEMERTLCRLPYLPLLGSFSRPVRTLVA